MNVRPVLLTNISTKKEYGTTADSVVTLQQEDSTFSNELTFMSINITSGESKSIDQMTVRLPVQVGCNWEKIVGSPGQGTAVFPVTTYLD